MRKRDPLVMEAKSRLTEAEYEDLQVAADMETGGNIAAYLRKTIREKLYGQLGSTVRDTPRASSPAAA
ncbi:hypothetical protein [Aquitalea aquatica]|uniref:Uncharacterized protein n=1 Tax=Aquitalea aquatica TaxID=3044273 RepID=A0A838Y925_9NEIS|nr:hypothetical protein [Aquitalea magnusonii]MBA4707535.1 hypothetical protein [Aquitalea magnusonii]